LLHLLFIYRIPKKSEQATLFIVIAKFIVTAKFIGITKLIVIARLIVIASEAKQSHNLKGKKEPVPFFTLYYF